MATTVDGATPNKSEGAGGKFQTKLIRPSDRLPTELRNSSPSLFAKLVVPTSRFIYTGAGKLIGIFRKELAAPRPPETREEPEPSTDKGGNLASISASPVMSELESLLKQNTFTRSEIEHLTDLLHAKILNSDGDERNEAKVVPSKTFGEDVASPAELAWATKDMEPKPDEGKSTTSGFQTPFGGAKGSFLSGSYAPTFVFGSASETKKPGSAFFTSTSSFAPQFTTPATAFTSQMTMKFTTTPTPSFGQPPPSSSGSATRHHPRTRRRGVVRKTRH